MSVWKVCGSVGLVLSAFSAQAFNEPGNILRDFEFNDAESCWGVTSARRGQIESFEGLAEPLFYLQGKGAGSLHQLFDVEARTWYVLSFRYRLTADGKGEKPDGVPFDCAVNVAPGETDAAFPPKTLGAMCLGATERWGRARLYFQTDDAPRASLNVAFLSGDWQVGRIFVRKANDRDRLYGGALDDPGFESTAPGDLPFEWRVTGRHDVLRLTVAENEAKEGRRALRAAFRKSLALAAPMCGFAKSGDALCASVWVKASRRALVQFKMTNPLGGVRRFNCRESLWLKPGVWTRFEVKGSPQCQPERRGYTGVQFLLDARTEDAEPTTLLVDDLNYSLVAPDEAFVGDPTRPHFPNASFEQGPAFARADFQIDATNVNDGVLRTFAVDETTAAVGKCSLKVRGNGFGFDTPPFRCHPDKPYTFSFWAKSMKRMRVRAGFPYARVGTWEIGPAWARYCGTAEPKRAYVSPGYCNLRFRTEGVAPDNVLWIDGIQLDYGAEMKPFRAEPCEIGAAFPVTYKVFPVGSRQKLDIRLANGGARGLKGEIAVITRDVRGDALKTSRIPVEIDAGDTQSFSRAYVVDEPGYRRIETTFVVDGQPICSNVTTCAGVAPPRPVPYGKSWAGILGGFDLSGRRGNTSSTVYFMSGSWNEALDALALLGYKWLRTMGCGNWRNTEYPQGTYNWKWDDYLADAKAHGMGVMVEFLCHDAPPWSHGRELGHPVQGGFTYSMRPADVERFAEDFARHYAGKFDAINLINETGGYPPDDFTELMEATYRGFKKVDPRIVVQGPGFPASRFPTLVETPGHETWIARALACGLNRWNDVHGIHPYDLGHAYHISSILRQPFERCISDSPGADGMTHYRYLAEQSRRFRAAYANNVIWDTESGAQFNTVAPWQFSPSEGRADWYAERLAAARAVRCNILRWSVGVERQFAFMFKSNLIYHGLDMMNIDMTPRAGVAALAHFNRLLDGGRFERLEEREDGTFTAYFTGWKGEKILVYWTPDHDTDGAPDGVFALPKGIRPLAVCDMEGRSLTTLPLSCEPVYVIYR